MSTIVMATIALASIATATLSALIGMGGGIVLLSLMTFFLPIKIIVPLHGVTQLISNSYRCWMLRNKIHRGMLAWFALGVPFGAIIAVQIIREIDSPAPFYLLIAAVISYTLFKPKKLPPIIIPIPAFCTLGFIVGLLGPLIGATGPLIAPFFLRDDLKKENIVATKGSVQMLGHLIKIPTFFYLGFDYSPYLLLLGLMFMGTIIGTRVGINLLGKIKDELFIRIYKAALLIAAFRLLYKAGSELF